MQFLKDNCHQIVSLTYRTLGFSAITPNNVNNQVSYFSELPQELKSVIFSKLFGFAKNGDKEAIKTLIQSAYISKQFFDDPEVKKVRNLYLLDIKMRKECPDAIYKVYLYSLDKLGFLPMIGNTDSGEGYLYPNVGEMKHPIAFVEDKESGQKGFVLKVHGRKETEAVALYGEKKIPVKDISDHIFAFQRHAGPNDWKITDFSKSSGPNLIYRFYIDEHDRINHPNNRVEWCQKCPESPVCQTKGWMPIIFNIIEGKEPYFELDSGK